MCLWCVHCAALVDAAAVVPQVLEGVVSVDMSHNQLQTGKGVFMNVGVWWAVSTVTFH